MEQTSSHSEFSENSQYVLKEVVGIMIEIRDLSRTIVTILQRPLVHGGKTDPIRGLVEETWTSLTTINLKVRTVQDILKTKFPHDLLDTKELDEQMKIPATDKPRFTHVTDKPRSTLVTSKPRSTISDPLAVPAVKGPSVSPVNTSTLSNNTQKPFTEITELPPRVPGNVSQVFVNDVGSVDNIEHTSQGDAMMRSNNLEQIGSRGNDIGSTTTSSGQTFGMETQLGYSDMLRQGIMPGFEIPLDHYEHLITWMGEQFQGSDGDSASPMGQLMKMITEDMFDNMKHGIRHMFNPSGEFNVDVISCFNQFYFDINDEVEKAKQSGSLPARGTGPDTILCLDISASMCGESFQKMNIAANKIIDGIEELANYKEVKGNIAVTTFGTETSIVLHLTNDYSQVRNVLGSLVTEGPSTLYRGLGMSIAACIANYAKVEVNDVRLMARIIVLTDGKFSADDAKEEHFEVHLENDTAVPSAATLMKMNGLVCYCVQIGTPVESELLQILTKTTNGKIFCDDHMDELVSMPMHLFEATNLLRQCPGLVDREKDAAENEEAALLALMSLESESRGEFDREFTDSEKETILALTMNISKLPLTKVAEQKDYFVQELDLDLPPVGTRVRRGPDWNPDDNQDSGGPGTIVYHRRNRSVGVLWDCGIIQVPISYRCYEPCQVLPTDTDERTLTTDGWIQVGCKVVRGPAWVYGDDDGGLGSCGVVCLFTRKGTVTVRWPSGKIADYRYADEVVFLDTANVRGQAAGYDVNIKTHEVEPGKKKNAKGYPDLKLPHTSYTSNLQQLRQNIFDDTIKAVPKDNTAEIQPIQQPDCITRDVQAKPETGSTTQILWSYLQEGQTEWSPFDTSNNRKLESEWSKQRKTAMVSINQKSYRVAFEKMTMTLIASKDGGTQLKFIMKRENRNEKDVHGDQS